MAVTRALSERVEDPGFDASWVVTLDTETAGNLIGGSEPDTVEPAQRVGAGLRA